MYVLLVMSLVDWLLPSVQIPMFGYVLILLLWVCKGAVMEARKTSSPTTDGSSAPVLEWLASSQYSGVYSTTEGDWSLVAESNGNHTLWQNDENGILLSAKDLGTALNQAECIIATLASAQKGN